MSKISLVCTEHEERGQVNVQNLNTILNHLKPEVIFLEIPSESLKTKYDISLFDNVEAKAVKLYQKNNHVELIGTDIPTPEAAFFDDYYYLISRIHGKSIKYRRDWLWYSNNV